MDILDSVLPATLDGDYHVLLITDNTQIVNQGEQVDPQEAVLEIQDVVPSLERPYRIIMEVIMVQPLEKGYARTPQNIALREFYQDTHDRHIISNYFIVSAEHALNAVKERNGKLVASFKQTLKFESIYAGIDNTYQDKKDLPVKGCDDFIKSVKKFTSGKSPACLYYINTKEGNVNDIRNRLLL
jgi:hypothetical protein